ncbi:MAG: hypothetical protein Dbin4_02414 [Alphaproteobacteria bacterium]|nr:hypothetical protein [Alphaproteobacteria bacterium]
MGLRSNPLSWKQNWRLATALLAAALLLARSLTPMSLLMPMGLSEITICGAHGVETILVDQDMNRVNPDTPPRPDTAHCGICTLAFGLAWAIALTLGLAPAAFHLLPLRNSLWPPQRRDFALAHPRAPPFFA